MNDDGSPGARFIWATRGRHWGFRFLLDAGFEDPLATYERAFDGAADSSSLLRHDGPIAALRFPDPEVRRDTAKRVIPHEFVLFGDFAGSVDSVEAGVSSVWPLVSDIYARIWEAENAPTRDELKGGR